MGKTSKKSRMKQRGPSLWVRGGAPRTEGRAAKHFRPRYVIGGLLLFIIVLIAGLVWRSQTATPAVVVPDRIERLQPALATLIQQHVDVVRSAPRDAIAHARLGLVYEANTLWPEARACFEIAYSLQPDEPIWAHHASMAARMSGDFEGALMALQLAATRFPEFAPIHFRLGDALLESGAVEAAAAAFKRVIAQAPSRFEGYAGLGDTEVRKGNHEAAVALLQKALELEPKDKTARYLLGTAYRAMGFSQEAEEQRRLGLYAKKRYIPDDWTAQAPSYNVTIWGRVSRSIQLREDGRPQEALHILEELWRTHRDNLTVMKQLGMTYFAVGRVRDARDLFERAKQIDEDDLSVCINLAACYLKLDRLEDAVREADRAAVLGPDVWQAHQGRGMALLGLGRYDDAHESLLAAVRLRPANPDLHQQLADVCMELKRYAEAKEHYDAAVDHSTQYMSTYVSLCRVCIQLNLWDEATAALNRAIRVAPNNPEVKELRTQLTQRKNE